MAAESNMSCCHEGSFMSSLGQNAISFQSGAINRSSEDRIQMNIYCEVNNYNAFMGFSRNLNIMSSNQMIPQVGNSFLVESMPWLKHEMGLAVEWSVEEQFTLEEGLKISSSPYRKGFGGIGQTRSGDRYENAPIIIKYVKIAAMLNGKTVRDVALRFRWLTDKSAGSSSNINKSFVSPLSLAPQSLFMNHFGRSESIIPFEALSGPTRHLLEQNNHVLGQIFANLSMFKIQENADLFFQTRNNLEIVLCNMGDMPGMISKIPTVPVAINDALANSLMRNTFQALFGSSSGIHLKQEPGCW